MATVKRVYSVNRKIDGHQLWYICTCGEYVDFHNEYRVRCKCGVLYQLNMIISRVKE